MLEFSTFLADRYGGRKWCVTTRLTDKLRRQGYEVAIPHKQFTELKTEWERKAFGAPISSLQAAAPEMLAALEHLVNAVEITAADIAVALAAIAKAKGCA